LKILESDREKLGKNVEKHWARRLLPSWGQAVFPSKSENRTVLCRNGMKVAKHKEEFCFIECFILRALRKSNYFSI